MDQQELKNVLELHRKEIERIGVELVDAHAIAENNFGIAKELRAELARYKKMDWANTERECEEIVRLKSELDAVKTGKGIANPYLVKDARIKELEAELERCKETRDHYASKHALCEIELEQANADLSAHKNICAQYSELVDVRKERDELKLIAESYGAKCQQLIKHYCNDDFWIGGPDLGGYAHDIALELAAVDKAIAMSTAQEITETQSPVLEKLANMSQESQNSDTSQEVAGKDSYRAMLLKLADRVEQYASAGCIEAYGANENSLSDTLDEARQTLAELGGKK